MLIVQAIYDLPSAFLAIPPKIHGQDHALRVATPVLTARFWAVFNGKPVKTTDQEVTNRTVERKKELAERGVRVLMERFVISVLEVSALLD